MATSAILVFQTLCPLPGEGIDSRYKAASKKISFSIFRRTDAAAKVAQMSEVLCANGAVRNSEQYVDDAPDDLWEIEDGHVELTLEEITCHTLEHMQEIAVEGCARQQEEP
jgi:hypothetical protein